mgnify:CR=1 FL=1
MSEQTSTPGAKQPEETGETASHDDSFRDPIEETPGYNATETRVAILGHPIHAMSVAFPVALTLCTFGADCLYWYTGQPFLARAAIWAAGIGFFFGMMAGFTGLFELLLVRGIRVRAAAWTHSIIAVMLLSLLGANWGQRLSGYEAGVLPYGILMSALSVVLVMVTGWHGGKLVFDYRLGVSKGN